jgi:hypothetical protein
MPKVNRENREAVCGHLFGDKPIDRLRDLKLAEAFLDRHLPAGRHAQKALIPLIGDRLACSAPERIIIANPPKKRVRV